jgi:hypothetical protein
MKGKEQEEDPRVLASVLTDRGLEWATASREDQELLCGGGAPWRYLSRIDIWLDGWTQELGWR